jgi:3-oxoadipate enol-lactonase
MTHPLLPHDDLGRGAPLVLLHAFPFDRRLFAPQRAALPAHVRLVLPDLHGFGAAADSPASTLEAHADDVARLLDHLRIERAVVAGVSMGGYAALAFLERHAARLAGLGLLNTRSAADTPEGAATRRATAARARAEGVEPVAAGMRARLISEATRSAQPELAATLDAWMLAQPAEGVACALEAMAARPDRTPLLRALAVPALVVAGDSDAIVPIADSQAMARAIPDAEFVVVPDTAHLAHLERPEVVNAALLRLVERAG